MCGLRQCRGLAINGKDVTKCHTASCEEGGTSFHPSSARECIKAVTDRTIPLHHMSLQNSLILGQSQGEIDEYRYFGGENGFSHHNGKVFWAPTVYSC